MNGNLIKFSVKAAHMIRKALKRWTIDRSGNVAMIFAFVMVPVVVAAGMSIDYGHAMTTRDKMQVAADSAALGAAASGSSDAEKIALAQSLFAANVTDLATSVTPNVAVNGTTVTVTAIHQVPTTFTKLAGVDNISINVSAAAAPAIASGSEEPPHCILLLEPSETGLYVNSDSGLDTDCKIQVNSTHEKAAELNSSATVNSAGLYVTGQAFLNSSSTSSPAPMEGSPTMDDPLSTLPEPPQANWGCDHTDFKVSSGQTATLSPGIYCGKTLIENGATANMQSGTYVFKKEFEVNSFGNVNGSGVLLVFKGSNAHMIINSDSSINVSAPTSGTYAGILMFQARDNNSASAPPFIVNSDSASKFEGTIYMPNGTLEVNSHSTANQLASYTAIVARKMILNSFGTFQIRSNYDGSTPFPNDLQEFKATSGVVLLN